VPGKKEDSRLFTSPGGCKEERRLWLYSALCVNVQCNPPLQVYSESMPHHTCLGLRPPQKHSCSRLFIFKERVQRPPDSNHQRFYPGISPFLSLLTLFQKQAIIASL